MVNKLKKSINDVANSKIVSNTKNKFNVSNFFKKNKDKEKNKEKDKANTKDDAKVKIEDNAKTKLIKDEHINNNDNYNKKETLSKSNNDSSKYRDVKKSKSKKINSKFDKTKIKKRTIRGILSEFLEKAGSDKSPSQINKNVVKSTLIICGVLSLALVVISIILSSRFDQVLVFLLFIWTIVLAGIYLIFLLLIFFYYDYKIYQRTKEIEEVLPEFLQLTSANISAGMTIDRALWFAVRPKFGVLAKEIEEVAKFTIAGDDLEQALLDFSKKYRSDVLKEAINLLIEGMRAGGEIGYLLNQISANMQDIKLMKQEISSSVTTYVIFITVAAIVGAPILLALSGQLLVIISSLTTGLSVSGSEGASSAFSLDLSADSISLEDFRAFSLVMLFFSSLFSSLIIGVIRSGSSKEGLKYIPPYIAVSYILYFAAAILFNLMLGSLF